MDDLLLLILMGTGITFACLFLIKGRALSALKIFFAILIIAVVIAAVFAR